MVVGIAPFAGEFALLAALIGESEGDLRADPDVDAHWLARDGERLIGAVLAGAIPGECYASFGRDEVPVLPGFAEYRREDDYEIPVARFVARVPPGFRIVPGDRTALEPLARLDAQLREDVPGADGWRVDLAEFRAQTYDSPYYDPATYRVALAGDAYAGLVRIWIGPRPLPRLGLIGVLAPHRRRGLARALIAAAFAPLLDRGVSAVTAEADTTNLASKSLLTGLGGRVTGGTVELRRPG